MQSTQARGYMKTLSKCAMLQSLIVCYAYQLYSVWIHDNLVAHPSNYAGNQSQQSIQWTHLNKHQS